MFRWGYFSKNAKKDFFSTSCDDVKPKRSHLDRISRVQQKDAYLKTSPVL